MRAAFSSEWVKLRRRAMLLWGIGGMLFFTVLATVFTIERAVRTLTPGFHGHGFRITIVVLALFAGATASEYSQGTLRKYLALAVFVLLALILAIVVAAAVAFAVGPGKGVHTAAWTSGTGLNDTFQAFLHIYLTSLGYGVLGTALAVLVRSPAIAITIGVAYTLPGEAIILAIWSGGDRWLPGRLLSAVAHGGTSSTSYSRALLLVVLYALVAAAGTLALFRRRDV
jgi:ABC-2 type transport system permease protein